MYSWMMGSRIVGLERVDTAAVPQLVVDWSACVHQKMIV